jgi:hypothetical protein
MQNIRVRHIKFVVEQDGEPERRFKARLIERFETRPDLTEAYLVRVQLDHLPELKVALCLKTRLGIDDREAVKAAGFEFQAIFGAHESIDIVFPTPAQAQQISAIARPFYQRPAKR